MIQKGTKIYVAGHRGLVGSAIWRNLQARGYHNLVGRSHTELDLLDPVATRDFFDHEQPEAVVLAAAKVGGIMANSQQRADFIFQNLQIQQNVIGEAWRHGVQDLLFLGSTCIYPRDAAQPMKEEALLTGELEYTNEPYAIAKIAGLKLCESLNIQYGTNYIAVMPTNLYGPNDNFDLMNSHVLPAMMRKIHLAKLLGEGDLEAVRRDLAMRPVAGVEADHLEQLGELYGVYPNEVRLWGTGSPLREFLWSEEMADASVHVLLHARFTDLYPAGSGEPRNCHINIGTGKEVTIKRLSELIAEEIGYNGTISWDSNKPDGTPRKLTDVTKLHRLGWQHKVELEEGIKRLYEWYTSPQSPPRPLKGELPAEGTSQSNPSDSSDKRYRLQGNLPAEGTSQSNPSDSSDKRHRLQGNLPAEGTSPTLPYIVPQVGGSPFRGRGGLTTILFDFGGVFVRLSREESVRRFEALGVHNANELLDPYQQQGLFLKLEEGVYDKETFTQALNEAYGLTLTVPQVNHALLGFLAEVQQYKFEYLRHGLPEGIRRLGISNINPFIWEYARSGEMIDGGYSVDDFFEKVYASYEHGICKPERAFFDLIIEDAKIRPEETLFIDDGPANTAIARELGFVTYCPDNGEDWRPILDKMLK